MECSCFVGDLSPEVNDFLLQESFRQFYPSVKSAKVITDAGTGRSKGYGFVRFASEAERDAALSMQGYPLANRPIRVSLATARRGAGGAAAAAASGGLVPPHMGLGAGAATVAAAPLPDSIPHPADVDPTNTTLFIGGLSAGVTEEQLRAVFGQFGPIVYEKVPAGKGCGFVQYVERASAEAAMAALNGRVLGANAMRISWGRSTARAAPAVAAAAAAARGAAAAFGAYGAGAGGGAFGAPALAGFPAAAFADPHFGGYGGAAGLLAAGGGGGAGAPGGFAMGAHLSAPLPAQHQAAAAAAAAAGLAAPAAALSAPPSLAAPPPAAGPGFDPCAPADVEKLNAAYAARQQQLLGGGGFLLPRP